MWLLAYTGEFTEDSVANRMIIRQLYIYLSNAKILLFVIERLLCSSSDISIYGKFILFKSDRNEINDGPFHDIAKKSYLQN